MKHLSSIPIVNEIQRQWKVRNKNERFSSRSVINGNAFISDMFSIGDTIRACTSLKEKSGKSLIVYHCAWFHRLAFSWLLVIVKNENTKVAPDLSWVYRPPIILQHIDYINISSYSFVRLVMQLKRDYDVQLKLKVLTAIDGHYLTFSLYKMMRE